ncbi:unnamed protein product [Brassica rapa subsp. trilocularis]
MTILVLERCHIIMNLFFGLITFILLNSAHCFYPKRLNISAATGDSDWSLAGATWYGSPTGYGSNGGACGYENAVAQAPFSSMVSAGGPSLYKSGKGCGACYQIKCTSKPACSTNPVTVVITDECKGCVTESVHFDLSGTAFGALASSGQDSQLRDVGVLQILYRKVECNYIGETVTFHVENGSNPYSFAALIEYEDGDGEIGLVELKQALDSDTWLPMSQSWGAVWKLDVTSPLRAPLSLRLTYLDSGETVMASDVIPAGWEPGEKYKSNNETKNASGWADADAGATWYGEPEGAGSTGGACGYGVAVANPPLNAMVSAGGPSLFNNGKGCGTCYQIMCTVNPACSGSPITVTITDECPGGPCASEPVHFDLTKPGQAAQLGSAGPVSVSYRRAACLYQGTEIAFHVDAGSTPFYVAFVVEYENGEGDLASVEIQPASGGFMPMQEMRSAEWKLNSGGPLSGPFNIRLTSGESRKVVVAQAVIPADWKPDQTYRSIVNF